MLDIAAWLAKNREDLKSMLASMRGISTPRTPAKAEPAAPREQCRKPK
jgi:hypothetical protein